MEFFRVCFAGSAPSSPTPIIITGMNSAPASGAGSQFVQDERRETGRRTRGAGDRDSNQITIITSVPLSSSAARLVMPDSCLTPSPSPFFSCPAPDFHLLLPVILYTRMIRQKMKKTPPVMTAKSFSFSPRMSQESKKNPTAKQKSRLFYSFPGV